MTHEISLVTLEAEVRKVAAARSDHAYPKLALSSGPSCYYDRDAEGEGPGHMCLIGEALYAITGELDGWQTYAGDVADLLTDTTDDTGGYHFKIVEVGEDTERDILRWLMRAQKAQDDEHSWGRAIADADEARANGWRDDDDDLH